MHIKKSKILLLILIFVLSNNLNAEEQVKVNFKASVENDTLLLNLSIINNNKETIYIPLSEWSLNGSYERNFFSHLPYYIFNTIIFYINDNGSTNIADGYHDYKSQKLPILGSLDSKDTFRVIVKLPFLDDSLRKYNKDYTICYYIPYSNERLLFEVEQALECAPSIDPIEGKFEIVLNKNKGLFQKEFFEECEVPEGMEKVMRIAFINYLEAKTTITKEELRKGKE